MSSAAPCHGHFTQSLWDSDHGQTAQRPPEVAAEATDIQIYSSWLSITPAKAHTALMVGRRCQELSSASPKQYSALVNSCMISGSKSPEG